MIRKNISRNKGQAALIVVVLFVLVSLTIVGSAALIGVSHIRSANELIKAKQVFATSESSLEDYGYRLLNGLAASSPITIGNLNGGQSRLTFTDDGSGNMVLDVEGSLPGLSIDTSNRVRNVSATASLQACKGISMVQGVQSGFLGMRSDGAFTLKHCDEDPSCSSYNPLSSKKGSIASNGSYRHTGGNAFLSISGDVRTAKPTFFSYNSSVSACSQPSAIAQSYAQKLTGDDLLGASGDFTNGQAGPTTNWYAENFMNSDNRVDLVQTFVAPMTGYVTNIELYVRRNSGTPIGNKQFDVYIQPLATATSTPPSNGVVSPRSRRANFDFGVTVDSFSSHTSWNWLRVDLDQTNYPVYENEPYALIIDRPNNSGDASKYLQIAVANSADAYIPGGPDTCYGEDYCNFNANSSLGPTQGSWKAPIGSPDVQKGQAYLSANWTSGVTAVPGSYKDIAFRVYFGSTHISNSQFPAGEQTSSNACSWLYAPFAKGLKVGQDVLSYLQEDTVAGNESYFSRAVQTAVGGFSTVFANTTEACADAPTPYCMFNNLTNTSYLSDPEPLGVSNTVNYLWQQSIRDMRLLVPNTTTFNLTLDIDLYSSATFQPKAFFLTPGTYSSLVVKDTTPITGEKTKVYLLGNVPLDAPTYRCLTHIDLLVGNCRFTYSIDGQPVEGLIIKQAGAGTGKCPGDAAFDECYVYNFNAADPPNALSQFLDQSTVQTAKPDRNAFLLFNHKVDAPSPGGSTDTATFTAVDGIIYVISDYYNRFHNNTNEPEYTIRNGNKVGGDLVLYAPMGEVYATSDTDIVAIAGARIRAANGAKIIYKEAAGEAAFPTNVKTSLNFSSYFESP